MPTVILVHTLPDNWHDPVLQPAQAQALLAQPGHILLLVKEGTENLGHLLGKTMPGEAGDILTLWVNPAHRGQGHGHRLMMQFIKHLKANGAAGLTLEVAATNTGAMHLYEAHGLTHRHTRPAYYPDGTDALVFSAEFA